MKHHEFCEWVQEAEVRYDVASWRVGGIRVWPLMRAALYASSVGARVAGFAIGGNSPFRYARIAASGISGWARARSVDYSANLNPGSPADAVFLSYSVGRQPLVGPVRVNPLLGPYAELLSRNGWRSTAWEMSPYGEYNLPRATPSFLMQPWILGWRAWSMVRSPWSQPAALEGYEQLVAEAQAARLTTPHGDRERLLRDVMFVRLLADNFKRWLARSGAKVGFVADASLREMAFCLACRELGLLSVEIQHGVQGVLHPLYGSCRAVPTDGWELRPEMFWSWDDASAAAINEWARLSHGSHEAVVGGNPWLDMWRSDSSVAAGPLLAAVRSRRASLGGTHHVLVALSSQGPAVPKCVLDAVLTAPDTWRFWFRLHPVGMETRRAAAGAALREIGQNPDLLAFASETPLPALLRVLDCHLTAGISSIVDEAAVFGMPSVALSDEAPQLFPLVAARGLLETATEPLEIVAALQRGMSRRREPSHTFPSPDVALSRVLAAATRIRGERQIT